MKKIWIAALPLALAMLLSSCTQTASSISSGEAVDIANTLTYVKDARTKQCFAVVASRHIADFKQNGFTITWVPCTPEVEAQIRK